MLFNIFAAKILHLRDEISATYVKLKEQRETDKSRRMHTTQNSAHNSRMEMDRRQRPSDRGMDIRQYGKMDADIWKYDTLRDWFNTYATPVTPENWSALESGYSIRIDQPAQRHQS
jgi:hypothetical protein